MNELSKFDTIDIPLEFSTKRRFAEVTIDGHKYQMVEFNGKDRDSYLSFVAKKSVHVGDRSMVKDFTGLSSKLISMCLFDAEADKLVDDKTIDGWPSNVIESLYKLATEINGLNKGADEEAKKK